MHKSIKYRATHIKDLWKCYIYKKWAIFIIGSFLYGLFTFWRDEFATTKQQENLRMINMLPTLPLSWWIIICLIAIIGWLFESSFKLTNELKKRIDDLEQNEISPLEIIFDPNNPLRRFWSIESEYENGAQKSMAFWEYRVEVKNISSRTLRNVSLTKEHIGQMPIRPADQPFDKIKKTSCDLKPGCSELVPVIHWPFPEIQAGMLVGEGYGPIKVTVSADDTKPTVRIFKFDYMREPMLYD